MHDEKKIKEILQNKKDQNQIVTIDGAQEYRCVPLDVSQEMMKEYAEHIRKQTIEEIVVKAEELEKHIKRADKTPKYEYSQNPCDANTAGEFAHDGARWSMPRELVQGFASRLSALNDLE